MTVRLEVERFDTTASVPRTTVVYVPSVNELDPAIAAHLQPHVARVVEEVAQQLDRHPEDAALLLAAELAERLADAQAYDREAARRGVLAL